MTVQQKLFRDRARSSQGGWKVYTASPLEEPLLFYIVASANLRSNPHWMRVGRRELCLCDMCMR